MAHFDDLLQSVGSKENCPVTFETIPMRAVSAGEEVILGLDDGTVVALKGDRTVRRFSPTDSGVCSLAAGKDWCVSGHRNGQVCLWRIETGDLVELKGHQREVNCVEMMSEDVCVTGSGDKTLRVWRLDQAVQLGVLTGHANSVLSLGRICRERCISGSQDGTIRVWSIEDFKELAVLEGHKRSVLCLAVVSEELCVSASDDGRLLVWDLTVFAQLAVLGLHTFGVNCLVLSAPMECLFAVSNEISIYDMRTRKLVRTLQGHTGGVYCVQVLPAQHWCVSGSGDNTMRVWDIDTGQCLGVFEGHCHRVMCLALTTTGECITGSLDHTARTWDLKYYQQVTINQTCGWVGHIVGMNDEQCLIQRRNDVMLYDLHSSRPRLAIPGEDNICMTTTDDGRVVVRTMWALSVWSLRENREVASLKGDWGRFTYMAAAAGKLVFMAEYIKSPRVLDLGTYREVGSLGDIQCDVHGLAVTQDNKCLFSSGNRLLVYGLLQLQQLADLEHSSKIQCLSVLESRQCLTGIADGTLCLWDISQYCQLATLAGLAKHVDMVAFVNEGWCVSASSLDHTIRWWNLQTCIPEHCIQEKVQSLAVSGQYLVINSHFQRIVIYDLSEYYTFPELHMPVTSDLSSCLARQLQRGEVAGLESTWRAREVGVDALHILAYHSNSSALATVLQHRVWPFVRGYFGSPLTLALQRKAAACVELLAQHCAKSCFDGNLRAVADDILELLKVQSPCVEELFGAIMQQHPLYPTEVFLSLSQAPPYTRFVTKAQPISEGSGDKVLVQVQLSRLSWELQPGSHDSLALLTALADCEKQRVLLSPYVQAIITAKWTYFWPVAMALTALYLLLVSLMLHSLFNPAQWAVCSFFALNIGFLAYEGVQYLATGRRYLSEVMNYIDLLRASSSLMWAVMLWLGLTPSQYLTVSVVALSFIRGFTYFRTFKMTRVFVYMTLQVVKDMYSFLLILGYSVFAFGILAAVLVPEAPNLLEAWKTAYNLTMGNSESSDFDELQWVVFTGATLVNIVIMLNLLISILGEAYEKTQMSLVESDLHLQLEVVQEFEGLLFWRRHLDARTLVLTIQQPGNTGQPEWTGKVLHITEHIKHNVVKVEQTIGEMHSKLEGRIGAVEAKLERQIGSVAHQVEEVQGRIDRVEASLSEVSQQLATLVRLQKATGRQ